MAEILTELVAKITADASELKKGLSSAEDAIDKAGGGIKSKVASIKTAISGISTAWAGVGIAIIGSMGMFAKSAMEAVESENLFTVSLGENAAAARKWSQDLGKALGLNTYELRKNVGVLYTMISSMGIAKGSALEMSEGMTQLAYDMASFYNLPTEEAFAKLRAGITGETEPLKRLGILVDEATIKTVALTHGIIEQGEELTQTQKVQARYLAIMEQTTASQGDLARTIDSPTNKMRVLGSAIDEVRIIIGEQLLPAVGGMLNTFGGIISAIKDWVQANPQLVKALLAAGLAVGGVITAVFALKAALLLLGTTANLMFGGILILIGALVTGAVLLAQNWDKVSQFFSDAWSKMKTAALTAVDSILSVLQKLIGWIPGLGAQIDKARDKISNMIDAEKIKNDVKDVKGYIDDLADTKIRKAQEATVAIKDSYDREKSAARDRYDAELADIDLLYDAKIKALDKTTNETIQRLEEQIDAIDKQTSLEELAIARAQEASRMAELEKAYLSAQTAEEKASTKKEWEEYITEIERKELLRRRTDEKDALREQIAETRERAQTERERLAEEEEALKSSLQAKYDAQIEYYNSLSARADEELSKSLARIETEKLAVLNAEQAKQNAMLSTFSQSSTGITPPIESSSHAEYTSNLGFPSGGLGPSLMGMPPMATVYGSGMIIPSGEGVTVNFTQPVFFDREETMNKFVDMIRKGIQRQDRLRFGGAYSG